MPTQNPRLTITLEPLLAAQLRRLSELTGNSQSKLISEILDGSTEVFARVIQVLGAAKNATASMKGQVSADMAAAQARIEDQLGLVLEEFDSSTAPLLEGVETVARRARKGTSGRTRSVGRSAPGATVPPRVTPPSNRGVRPVDNSTPPRAKHSKRAPK